MAQKIFQLNRCEQLKYCCLLRLVVKPSTLRVTTTTRTRPERLTVKRQGLDNSGLGGGKHPHQNIIIIIIIIIMVGFEEYSQESEKFLILKIASPADFETLHAF
jgi:hypothetical protein